MIGTTIFDNNTEKESGHREVSMARIVINILGAISTKYPDSQKPGSVCCNQVEERNIETDGSWLQSEYRSNKERETIAQTTSIPRTKNAYVNADMSRNGFPTSTKQTIPNHDTPNICKSTGHATHFIECRKQPFSCGNAKDSADANAPDELNTHEKGTIPYTKAEQKQIGILDRGSSLVSADGDEENQLNKANLTEGQDRSNICAESPTNPIDRLEQTTTNDTDNLHEILSKTHDKRNTGTEDISKSEDVCSASEGSQWSLKKIMDEYDEKYPDEDEEANSFHNTSRYFCDSMIR